MTKLKPVWRINTGVKPNDRLEDSPVLEVSGRLTDSGYNHFIWGLDDKKCYPIAAYQTNRAKAAKFERVTCDSCNGHGGIIHEYRGPTREHQFTETCNKCNGTGRMARRITC